MAQGSFEFLDHTADVAVRLVAPTLKDLFKIAVSATLAIYVEEGDQAAVGVTQSVPVKLSAEDEESLLVDFLHEIVYLFDAKQFLAVKLEQAQVQGATLTGTLRGSHVDVEHFPLRTEIKAATQHDLTIHRVEGGFQADVVFDL